MEPSSFPVLTIPSINFSSSAVQNPESFLEFVEKSYLEGTRNHIFVALNAEKVWNTQKFPTLKECLKKASANFVDGIGVVLAFKILHGIRVKRTWGFDLLLRWLANKKGTVFLFGSEEKVNEKASQIIKANYPGIQVIGRCSGYNVDNEQLKTKIESLKPDLLVVALGSPKQEEWIWNFGRFTGARWMMGVGGALDATVGAVTRAPTWVQRIGLEWLYRLLRQPTRIRRQMILFRFLNTIIFNK